MVKAFTAGINCIWCLPGWWAVVLCNRFLTFRLHLWQASSEVAASTVTSEVLLWLLLPYVPDTVSTEATVEADTTEDAYHRCRLNVRNS